MITTWKKARRSNDSGGNCVEWDNTDDMVRIRDSKNPGGPELLATADDWSGLVSAVAAGRTHPWVSFAADGVHLKHGAVTLWFRVAEWDAFAEFCRTGDWTPVPA